MRPQFVLGLLATAFFDVSVFAATFTVTTTADTGPGSFDQAILDANATPGPDNIHFNIGSGPQIITTGAIPIITDAVVIDGTTQPGYSGTPIVTLDATNIVTIAVSHPTTGTVMTNNFIGTNLTGHLRQHGERNGVSGCPASRTVDRQCRSGKPDRHRGSECQAPSRRL